MALLCPSRVTSFRYKLWNTLPLDFTAALATCVSTRRILRLPFGLRLLLDTPADSSRPGHVPTHDDSCSGDGNVAAAGPTSAITGCAEWMPKPGTSASRCTAS